MNHSLGEQQKLSKLLLNLWGHILPWRRIQIIVLCGLILVSTVAELISIGAVLPFLGILTAPERVFEHTWMKPLISFLGIHEPRQLLLPMTAIFSIAAVFSGVIRFSLLWGQTRIGNAIGVDLGSEAYRRTLYQPYIVHVARNSSEIVAALVTKVNTVIYYVVIPFLTLIASLFIVFIIVIAMIWVEPVLTLIAFLGFGGIYGIVAFLSRKFAVKESERVAMGQFEVTKVVQEGLGGIRDVIIDGLQEVYFTNYRRSDNKLRRALANITILSGAPRPAIESLGVVLLGFLAYFMACRPEGMATGIPLLGALALTAQRMLPLVQQGYASWTSMHGGKESLKEVLDLLNQQIPMECIFSEESPITFKDKIRLKGLNYRYGSDSDLVLKDINLDIPRGSRVGFIGETGSGKSTLLDIIMGLLEPTSGTLSVDGLVIDEQKRRSWLKCVSHVPQSIYLADICIEENIAFGYPSEKIDSSKVRDAAQRAQISTTIESLPDGYKTVVGERGVRMSGGQCQRIGIARALYKNADVIVLDEATSALDNETEKAVMDAIAQLRGELTILIVAHRLSTLKICDLIIELENGTVRNMGTYQELIGQKIGLVG